MGLWRVKKFFRKKRLIRLLIKNRSKKGVFYYILCLAKLFDDSRHN